MSQPEPPKAPQRTPPPPKSEHDHLRQDLQELTAELQDLARKISADIDTRFAKLESAMRDADRRIATLHRLNRKPLSKSAAPARPAGEQQGGSNDARHNIVYELADAGFTPMEIARDLGKTTGEIELILNLRPKTPKRTQEG